MSRDGPVLQIAWERELRLWAGLILFAFVTTHLLNHALGIFGIETMEAVQHWRVALWRSWPGTVALYAAALIHLALGLKRIVWRRTWRMPAGEAAQMILGLSIPFLLLEHALGTRYASLYLGTEHQYSVVLAILASKQIWQIVLVLVVWFHGVIGIHYAFRARIWFRHVRDAGLILAFAIPILAIAGFIAGAREAAELSPPGAVWTQGQIESFRHVVDLATYALIAITVGVIAVILSAEGVRRFSGQVPVHYMGHGNLLVRPGLTLLEASRDNGIPHPSVCGGRGRCSTCRVLILSGHQTLPEPGPAERAVLKRISAPSRVRLACQIRPAGELSVQILLPTVARGSRLDLDEEAYKWGIEREVTILIVDIRAFTMLARKQLPQDTVVFVNRFVAEMSQAVEARGGRVGMYTGDGLMAIFGLEGQRGFGSRSAIQSATDMLKVVRSLNSEFGPAIPMPLRVGIGVHTGKAVIARVGDAERGYMMTALGETVSIAGRLESATKELLADCIVSEAALAASGLALPGAMPREVHMRGHDKPIKVHALNEAIPEDAAA
jgi:adenylate cyclase